MSNCTLPTFSPFMSSDATLLVIHLAPLTVNEILYLISRFNKILLSFRYHIASHLRKQTFSAIDYASWDFLVSTTFAPNAADASEQRRAPGGRLCGTTLWLPAYWRVLPSRIPGKCRNCSGRRHPPVLQRACTSERPGSSPC